MQKGRIFFKILLLFLLLSSVITLFAHKKTSALEILKGYLDLSEITSDVSYSQTKLRSFPTDPNFTFKEDFDLSSQPMINGKIGFMADVNSGSILYEKEAYSRKEIASLVKIMTAVIALEHSNMDDLIYVTNTSSSVGENVMGISAGEVYTLKELLYGLIMHSGNDAAYAIAEGVGGSSSIFVDWMNIKAQELNLKNTYFADPSGLDDATYSTAEDLAKLTIYALKFPEFKEIAETLEIELISDDHKYLSLYNQTNLLSTYPGVKGVKTGFTELAGLCLVTYADNDGREVVGIVLDSLDRKGDMILMLDHAYQLLGVDVTHSLL